MSLYKVCIKYGKSRFHSVAFVEADSPTKAIALYKQSGDTVYDESDLVRYRADIRPLPDRFWDMASDIRPLYIEGKGT